MFRHSKELQFDVKPERPDALFAAKLQELVGGQFGEMTVMMQYLWQGWNCRMPGKYKDMIMDIGTEEIGHVEMLVTMMARLLEGAPSETQAEAAAANPALAAVLGGQNVQHAIVTGGAATPTNSQGVPWNGGYIVASGSLLTDFRSNVAAEAQSRLQTARVYQMTDDPGVKETLQFNLARDTFHQQQWLLGIEQLIEDGFTDGIEDSLAAEEKTEPGRTFYSFHEGSTAHEGRWAQGTTIIGGHTIAFEEGRPLGDDIQEVPAPDPLLFATYDGSKGPGKPGNAAGAYAQGAENLLHKAKEKLTGE
ncbi:manganese catalase family protein [Nocardioides sp. ChNu-153]|uniref:manganese catalase family protein n=1 Tax=unclassified Nocardioides TaxID=2615069 RepID=UPI002406AE34|nr:MULTISPECIES: manganese catalase family protein [unclassified Nocardioides]MDF9716106.1 manganese catalase family protein [Nocardioides sp. ChNu-99]MDN7122183.1 manganese catalase family protein [Nocardioides sp. ChNu-153]